jgi:hypothetical protein
VEISFDLQPFQALELAREVAFDRERGIITTVKTGFRGPKFGFSITLRLSAHDPQLRGHPANTYDFTFPEDSYRHDA